MGKGDKKSKKGKIFIGSYGNSRKRASNKASVAVKTVPTPVVVEAVAEEKPKAKRTTKKKETAE
jgi:30S ribosomal protein S31